MTASRPSVCPGCGREVALGVDRPSLLACPACATLFEVLPPEVSRPVVVVAHGDAAFRAAATVRLEAAGFECVVAADGEAARAAVDLHRPGAVILDVALSGALAHAWIPELRARPDLVDVRIVLVETAHDREAFRRRPRSLHGADALLDSADVHDLAPRLMALMASPPDRRPE